MKRMNNAESQIEPPNQSEAQDSAQRAKRTFSLKFEGGRFDEPMWTIETLRDVVTELENFQTALTATARHIWEQEHPGEPVPGGFEKATELRIDISKLRFELPASTEPSDDIESAMPGTGTTPDAVTIDPQKPNSTVAAEGTAP